MQGYNVTIQNGDGDVAMVIGPYLEERAKKVAEDLNRAFEGDRFAVEDEDGMVIRSFATYGWLHRPTTADNILGALEIATAESLQGCDPL